VSEIILNLKQLRFKLHADYKISARFKKTGPGELKASDLQADPGVEVLNPELHIATLNKDAEIDMEVEISGGRGYVPADQQEDERPIGVVPVDAHFSPIKKVNFGVENTRVGQRVDFDKLTLELWSDGSILPRDAMAYAAMILKDHFSMFVDFEEPIEREVEKEEDKEGIRIRDLMTKSVEELELSVRSANCLRSAGIKTIGELVQKSESAMLKYRNFGRKSLKEISDILGEMGLQFGMDVSPYAGKPAPQPEFEVPGDEGDDEGPGDDTGEDMLGAALGEAPEVRDDQDDQDDQGEIDGSFESEDESEEKDDETLKTPEEPAPATTPSEE
jgi:DNA-directed RNA polymerase subunit alpha